MGNDSEKALVPGRIATNSNQDPVSSAMNGYLKVTSHRAQPSQLAPEHVEKRNAVFKDVKVWGRDSQLEHLETIAHILLGPVTLTQKIFSRKKPVKKMIQHGIDGIVQECEILLVLGRPGSGCTTLLKTLSGSTETFYGWSGSIAYFGHPVDVVRKNYRGDLVYNAEGQSLEYWLGDLVFMMFCVGDVHFPYLTVMRTLGFAVNTKTPTNDIRPSERKIKVNNVTNAFLKVFGLKGTRTTMVGNEFITGASGGERKRVSLAEVASRAQPRQTLLQH